MKCRKRGEGQVGGDRSLGHCHCHFHKWKNPVWQNERSHPKSPRRMQGVSIFHPSSTPAWGAGFSPLSEDNWRSHNCCTPMKSSTNSWQTSVMDNFNIPTSYSLPAYICGIILWLSIICSILHKGLSHRSSRSATHLPRVRSCAILCSRLRTLRLILVASWLKGTQSINDRARSKPISF